MGPQASDQVSQSGQAGIWVEADTRDWPSGCWFLKGPFLSGNMAIPLPRAPTWITMLTMAGMEGWTRTLKSGEKKYNLKKNLNPSEFLPIL